MNEISAETNGDDWRRMHHRVLFSASIVEYANGEVYLMKEETMSGRGKIRMPAVPPPDDFGELFHAHFASSDLQHGTHQSTHHSSQKTVGFYAINGAVFVLCPGAFVDRAEEGFYLGAPLGKCGEIMEFGEHGGGRPELLPIEGIGIVPGPVCQEGVLFPVKVIAVFAAQGIIAAVGIGGNDPDALEDDIGGQDRVDVIEHPVFYISLVITMEIVLQGVDAAVGAGGAGEGKRLAEEDLQCFSDLLLDRGGVLLDLESAVLGAFVGDFQEISGHAAKIGGRRVDYCI